MTEPPARPMAGERASHLVHANGIWQHALEYGTSGPTLVLIPGITSAAATMSASARRLGASHRVVVVDLRGRGLSDHPPCPYDLDSYVDDVSALVAALRVPDPILVGTSLGARVAAGVDVRHRGQARGLVLVDPPLSGPGRAPYPFELDMYESLLDAVSGPTGLDELGRLEPWHDRPQLAERLRWLRTVDPRAVRETHAGFHSDDFLDLWTRLGTPAVLVRGADSPVVDASGAAELARSRPDIPIVDVPGAGHLVHLDNPDGFVAAVTSSVDRLTAVDDPPKETTDGDRRASGH